MTSTHPVIERYLSRLDAQLSDLPAMDRAEVLHDIRSHLAEAMAAGQPLDAALESLGPVETLARAYAVELMLNPRRSAAGRRFSRLKIAGLIAAGSIPTLFGVITLGGLGASLVAAGLLAMIAAVLDASGNLPSFIQTSGLPPVSTLAIGVAMTMLGVVALFGLRHFVRFVAATWRAALPKLV